MLKIVVCIKQVLDPEAPVAAYEIDSEKKRVIMKGVQPVLNPFDENALEAALRISDTNESKITVISLGKNLAKPLLRKSLAVGAHDLILLDDNAFEDLDSYTTAYLLASAIKNIGEFDIILTGREAADTNAGIVGSGIAEILSIASITLAGMITFDGRNIKVKRVTSDGYEVIESSLPVLVTVSNELGELRSVGVKALLEAQKKQITTLTAQDISLEAFPSKRTNMLNLYKPFKQVNCEIVEGASPEEAAFNLAIRLKDNGIL